MKSDAPRSPEIIAHRGFSGRFPENTIPALLGAFDAGCSSLEFDLRWTADGIPILFHDETLDRTTDGAGAVAELVFSDIARLDAGSWYSPGFAGVRVPSLEEAVAHIRSRARHIYAEVKAVPEPAALDALLEILRRTGIHPHTTVISLDHDLLEELRARDSELELGWVVASEERFEPALRTVAADGRALLDPDAQLLLDVPERTREVVSREVPLVTWTVDDPRRAEQLRRLGVRRITTNEVLRLLAWARDAGRVDADSKPECGDIGAQPRPPSGGTG